MKWTKNLAYAVGLIATDGNLSKDGRHIELTSKDREQIENLTQALKLTAKIGTKASSYNPGGTYYRIQFSNVKLYRFLLQIGLTPKKTKIISALLVPNKYFPDYLRGYLDGDGYTSSFYDNRWKNSFRLYTGFISASKAHLEWIKEKVKELYQLEGKIRDPYKSTYDLRYSKKASLKLLGKIYYKKGLLCLGRKHSKIERALGIIGKQAGMLKLVNRLP